MPTADRPEIPSAYGVSRSKRGLLPWTWAQERLAAAQNCWVVTVRPDGRPHSVPVWGVWLEDCFFFGGTGVKARNLATNSAVVVHLERADEVVIVEGTYDAAFVVEPELRTRLREASKQKYGFGGGDSDGEEESTFVVRPRMVLGWSNMLRDATRWRFD